MRRLFAIVALLMVLVVPVFADAIAVYDNSGNVLYTTTADNIKAILVKNNATFNVSVPNKYAGLDVYLVSDFCTGLEKSIKMTQVGTSMIYNTELEVPIGCSYTYGIVSCYGQINKINKSFTINEGLFMDDNIESATLIGSLELNYREIKLTKLSDREKLLACYNGFSVTPTYTSSDEEVAVIGYNGVIVPLKMEHQLLRLRIVESKFCVN